MSEELSYKEELQMKNKKKKKQLRITFKEAVDFLKFNLE